MKFSIIRIRCDKGFICLIFSLFYNWERTPEVSRKNQIHYELYKEFVYVVCVWSTLVIIISGFSHTFITVVWFLENHTKFRHHLLRYCVLGYFDAFHKKKIKKKEMIAINIQRWALKLAHDIGNKYIFHTDDYHVHKPQ